jgi:hypothetical protein
MKLKFFYADEHLDKYNILGWLQLLIGSGLLFLLLYSLQFWQHLWHAGAVVRIFGVAILTALGFLVVGFVLGFIFCIPRTPARSTTGAANYAAGGGGHSDDGSGAAGTHADPVETNSNLNEISDWLTKIIVGVGLVELNKIPGKLSDLATYIGSGLRNCSATASDPCVKNSEALALGIVIFFFAAGFLFGYIWTRFYYQRTLSELAGRAERVDRAWTNTLWAEVLLQQNALSDANSAIDQSLAINPTSSGALLTKGRILKRMAQSQGPGVNPDLLRQALKFASQAWELKPDRPQPAYNVACYQALLGMDKTEVLKNLQKAIQLDARLKQAARNDPDFQSLSQDTDFQNLTA